MRRLKFRIGKLVPAIAVGLMVSGCASAPAIRVSDADGVESISAIAMGCNKPFELTQDCTIWSGPTKKISVDGHPVKVAGSSDGTITVMFGGGTAKSTQNSNVGYELLKKALIQRGYVISSVTPIESGGIMFGYAIETSEPSYRLWDEFAIE